MRSKIFILLATLLLMSPIVFAEEEIPCDSFEGSFLNSCNPDEVNKDKNRWGGGTEVPLWIHEKVIIEQELRVDQDGNIGTYTMVNPQMEKGLFQHIGDFFRKLFKRGGE